MRFYVILIFVGIIILYTAFIKLSVGLPVRTLLTVFATLLLFVFYNKTTMKIINRHFVTLFLFVSLTIVGAFLTIIHGRGIGTVVGYTLANMVQPFLIFVITCIMIRLAGLKFTGWVFIISALVTGTVAILQFANFDPAWQLRAVLGHIQNSPANIEEGVATRDRPMGLSLTAIVISYHIATAYIIANLFYRRQMVSPGIYRVMVLAMMVMSAATGTRSLLGAIFAHEVLFNFRKLHLGSTLWLLLLISLGAMGFLYLEAADSRVASLDDASAVGRLVLWTYGSHLAIDNPFGLGWGFNPSDYAWLYWEELSDFVKADAVFRLAIHNTFLNFFLTYGLYGVLVMAAAFYMKPRKLMAVVLAFTAYWINAFFHNAGVFVSEYYFWFGFAIFVYLYDEQPETDRAPSYTMTPWQPAPAGFAPAMAQGSRASVPDSTLLREIKVDLETFPFDGEHRDVWARLRVVHGIRVSPRRVLRVMRENGLLSADRPRPNGGNGHGLEVFESDPGATWSTSGLRVYTVDDGWAWIFTVIEHQDGTCIDWRVGKRGDRFAALQPVSTAISRCYGSTAAGIARGLVLRIGHGSQYLSDDFIKQIRYWGMEPAYAFVEQPSDSGACERFDLALKEEILRGRTYRNIEELQNAFQDFAERYNAQMLGNDQSDEDHSDEAVPLRRSQQG